MSLLELNRISKAYQDGDQENIVLKDLSLKIEKGEFVAIVGPSGAGKSTLLTIAGMLLSPDSGTILIEGQDVSQLSPKKWTRLRREKLGFIFQSHQLLPFLTAEENLLEVAKLHAYPNKDEAKAAVAQVLKDLDMEASAKKYPHQLSGGQKQRIAIGRAFITKPAVILADEPTASLDQERGRRIAELIQQEVKKYNTSALMVTHDLRILDLVDRVYRLEGGKLVEDPQAKEAAGHK